MNRINGVHVWDIFVRLFHWLRDLILFTPVLNMFRFHPH